MTTEIPDRDRLEVTDEEGVILRRLAVYRKRVP